MSSYVLGISSFYHDSAAVILKDGEIIAAAQEERFSRKKHDPRFPHNAINYCMEEAFIEADEIDVIAFYDNPILTYDRVLQNCIYAGEASQEIFNQATKSILGSKLWFKDHVELALGNISSDTKIIYVGHHMSHAASAFFPTTFKDAAILTIDGVGEWNTTTISKGVDNKIEILKTINYPHSLGLLYSAFTYYCGFKVNSGEYKLMGLAPYGQPLYADKIKEHLIDIKDDGSFRLNMKYFAFMDSFRTINESFEELFGGKARAPESRITQREMDLAASIQKVTEEVVIKLARTAKRITGSSKLCLAGGVALNCVANGKILKEKIFDQVWIQPAAGDAGGALGAAYVAHYFYNKNERIYPDSNDKDLQKSSYLGPQFSPQEIKGFLDRNSYTYTEFQDQEKRYDYLASQLKNGKILGFFSGRMEFGPRALGGRSIIGDARSPEMQSKMNLKIKYRESFRPFAPIVLEEDSKQYFDLDDVSPYMLLVAPVKEERRKNINIAEGEKEEDMISIINQVRSDVPAITHVDYSARVQTVTEKDNPDIYRLIKSFKNQTGYGILVNTSFNVRGEPIVCTPKDAYTCFMRTDMDVLVLDDFVLIKEDQAVYEEQVDWQKEFELD